MKPLYVSFFTPTYAAEAAALVKTLELFNLPHQVEEIAPFGGWLEHIQYKPWFLLAKMMEHPNRPLVWLDADARVRKHPQLFDVITCDFAAHWRIGEELLSSTMYFAPTIAAHNLLIRWHDACIGSPHWDQKELQRIIFNKTPVPQGMITREDGLQVCNLPPEYAAIFDFDMCPIGDWVISQHQASRRLKNTV